MYSETLFPSFDFMFALRISYTDMYIDEHIIIKKLKSYILELEPNDDLVNKYLIDFYKEYNIDIDTSILEDFIDDNSDSSIENDNKYELIIDYKENKEYKEYKEYKLDSPPGRDSISNSELINIFMQSFLSNNNNYNTILDNNDIIPNPLLNIYNPTQFNNINNQTLLTYNPNMLISVINNILNEDITEYNDVKITLDETEFTKIKSYKQEEDTEIQCAICCDNFVKNINVSELPCNHKYHSECISTYLKEYNYICPVCRAEVGKSKAHI